MIGHERGPHEADIHEAEDGREHDDEVAQGRGYAPTLGYSSSSCSRESSTSDWISAFSCRPRSWPIIGSTFQSLVRCSLAPCVVTMAGGGAKPRWFSPRVPVVGAFLVDVGRIDLGSRRCSTPNPETFWVAAATENPECVGGSRPRAACSSIEASWMTRTESFYESRSARTAESDGPLQPWRRSCAERDDSMRRLFNSERLWSSNPPCRRPTTNPEWVSERKLAIARLHRAVEIRPGLCRRPRQPGLSALEEG